MAFQPPCNLARQNYGEGRNDFGYLQTHITHCCLRSFPIRLAGALLSSLSPYGVPGSGRALILPRIHRNGQFAGIRYGHESREGTVAQICQLFVLFQTLRHTHSKSLPWIYEPSPDSAICRSLTLRCCAQLITRPSPVPTMSSVRTFFKRRPQIIPVCLLRIIFNSRCNKAFYRIWIRYSCLEHQCAFCPRICITRMGERSRLQKCRRVIQCSAAGSTA